MSQYFWIYFKRYAARCGTYFYTSLFSCTGAINFCVSHVLKYLVKLQLYVGEAFGEAQSRVMEDGETLDINSIFFQNITLLFTTVEHTKVTVR